MRMELSMEIKKPEFSRDYRRVFISFIKAALSEYHEGVLMTEFYNGTVQKGYTWSIIFQNPKFEEKKIVLEGTRLKMIISSEDANKVGYFLFSAFTKMKGLEYPLENGNTMRLDKLEVLNQKIITESSCIMKTVAGAPIVVRDHNRENNKDRYYSVEDLVFIRELEGALKRQAEKAGFAEKEIQQIKAKVISGKKVIVFHYDVFLDASAAVIELQGPPELLQHFYQNGISGRRSSGFGMLNLIAQKAREGGIQ